MELSDELSFHWMYIAMVLPKIATYYLVKPREYEGAFRNMTLVVESIESFYQGLQELSSEIREDYDEVVVMMVREAVRVIEQIPNQVVKEVFRREFNRRIYELYCLM